MPFYRFLDGMGDVVADGDYAVHDASLAWARADAEHEENLLRVEYLGSRGDWRWEGPLLH